MTPTQIAAAALEAADAGAAIVHIHVRDPETGKGSRRLELYEGVVERIRSSGTDVLINLTTGMGGDVLVGPRWRQRHSGRGERFRRGAPRGSSMSSRCARTSARSTAEA